MCEETALQMRAGLGQSVEHTRCDLYHDGSFKLWSNKLTTLLIIDIVRRRAKRCSGAQSGTTPSNARANNSSA